jgi:methylated-DNA-[protein]-cysteine S-methyltransferase
MTDTLATTTLPTPIGSLGLVASEVGLRAVIFESEARGPRHFAAELVDAPAHPVLAVAVEQLEAYFAGERRDFDLPLELVGTEFQLLAWRALATVPYGETVSYAEQARRIGRPTAVRAIGAANGRNPVPVVLPCHRVVGADGSLTGFGGGLGTKAALLDLERAHVGSGTTSHQTVLPLRMGYQPQVVDIPSRT